MQFEFRTHGGETVNKDRVKGKLDDAAGRAKRQVGEWTGDTKAQVEGAAQQVKGKAENAWGKMKDAASDAEDEVKGPHGKSEETEAERREIERERSKQHDVA
jgi:uncharacterized protein YjbJ (UPF0337 family)